MIKQEGAKAPFLLPFSQNLYPLADKQEKIPPGAGYLGAGYVKTTASTPQILKSSNPPACKRHWFTSTTL
jgi:hypothetical protein